MAVTHAPAGFTGTVDQVDEARRFANGGGGRFKVASSTDWTPSASGSVNRTVNIAAGAGLACGVYDSTTASDSVVFAANGGGTDRFDVVVATFDWAVPSVSFRVIQGTTALPTIVKTGTTVDATKINWLPGLRYDAVIAVIRARPGVTLLAPADLYDCRPWGQWSRLNVSSAAFMDALDVDAGGEIFDGTDVWRKRPNGLWFGGTALDIPLSGSFTAEPDTGYGKPRGQQMPWGEIRLSGMVRQPTVTNSTATGGALQTFTTALPSALQTSGSTPRIIGVASTASGFCEIYLTGAGVLAYAFRADTVVYTSASWYINLNSLSYRP